MLFKVREQANDTTLLIQKVGGDKRVLAKFKDRWATALYSGEASVGVVLAKPKPLAYPARVWGSEAVVVHANGAIDNLVTQVPIAGEPTCSISGDCYVPISDTECAGNECDDVLVKINSEKQTLLKTPRGMGFSVSPDGHWIAVIESDKDRPASYRLFDAQAQRWGPTLGDRPSRTAIWSPNGGFIAHLTGGPPPTWRMLIWDTQGHKVAEFEVPYRSELVVWETDAM